MLQNYPAASKGIPWHNLEAYDYTFECPLVNSHLVSFLVYGALQSVKIKCYNNCTLR